MGLVLIIVGLVLGFACFGALIYFLRKFCKRLPLGGVVPKVEGNDRSTFLTLVLVQGITFVMMSFGMILYNGWSLSFGQYVLVIFGGYLLATCFDLLVSSFTLYFYRKDLDVKQRKVAQIAMISAIPLLILGLWLWSDGIASFVSYPLPNSISFTNGVGHPNVAETGLSIAFYGIIIVGGAVISYFIGDHYVYTKFGKHGLLDTLFLVAFPMGLVGARLWWCIVLEPSQIFYGNFWDSFVRLIDVRRGGLAIQGGAILGMISGIAFALKFRKYINIRWLVDVCVPTILIAQAVGRWGNFFNQEVFGNAADINNWWFLPQMIRNNMVISSTDGLTTFRVPLFLIESAINMCGYFIIRYAVGHGLKKYLRQGDQGFLYVIWYGLVRVALEPLRVGFTLNLGHSEAFGYLQSWITAFAMVLIGILGMVGIRIFEHIRRKKGFEVKEYEAI